MSLTCPVAAELALSSDDAIMLEIGEIPDLNIYAKSNRIPASVQPYFSVMQLAATNILKSMDFLTINQRLAVLGSFWLNVDNLIKDGKEKEIENLAQIFMSPNFWEEYGDNLFEEINFDYEKFLTVMFDCVIKVVLLTHETSLKEIFMPRVNDSEKIDTELSKKKFIEMNFLISNFVAKMDTVFSNYIVHEIFYNLYPFRVDGSIAHNFAVMVATYKYIELMTSLQNFQTPSLRGIVENVSWRVRRINSDRNYLKNLSDELKDYKDMTEIISTFLMI